MALNLGLRVLIVLVCLSLAFTILPRTCSPAEVAVGHDGCIGYGTGINIISGTAQTTTFSIIGGYFGSVDNTGAPTSGSSTTVWWVILLGTLTVGAIASIIFPNQFVIFAIISGTLMTSLIAIPWDLVQTTSTIGLPFPFNALVAVIMFMMIFFVVLSFLKQGDF